MAVQKVVVDGSNIATEGRTMPSLAQLEEAVAAFQQEFPDSEIAVVVVDATFAHRIEPHERPRFEEAYAHNEVVCPPAGAIGRGDAFLLQIADRIGAVVFSNDSFQEFHGEYEWLFTEGRLMGGKPVPGVGWIFTPRTPVRGVKSRKAVKEARKKGAFGPTVSGAPLGPPPVPSRPPPRKKGAPRPGDATAVAQAIADATQAAIDPHGDANDSEARGRRRRRRRKAPGAERPAEPVNDPLPFLSFITEHPLGAQVEGEVESFTSHGAFVLAGGARCYVPITALGDPPPRAAREVLNRGETRMFTVQAFDAPRRGIELALPEFVHVSGSPTSETIEAEIHDPRPSDDVAPAGDGAAPAGSGATKGRRSKKAAAPEAPDEATTPAKKQAKKAPTKAAAAKKAAATKAPATKAPAKKAPAAKAVVTKTPAKKTPTPATEAVAPAKAAAKKVSTKKVAAAEQPAAKKAAKATKASTKAASKTAKAAKPAAKTAKTAKAPTPAAKVRVHELAKELGIPSSEVLARAGALGIAAKAASSTISSNDAARIRTA